ncbi:MAG: hypothetical protein R3A44_01515 [Caldilineaceae bacterium]
MTKNLRKSAKSAYKILLSDSLLDGRKTKIALEVSLSSAIFILPKRPQRRPPTGRRPKGRHAALSTQRTESTLYPFCTPPLLAMGTNWSLVCGLLKA